MCEKKRRGRVLCSKRKGVYKIKKDRGERWQDKGWERIRGDREGAEERDNRKGER